MQVIGKGTGNTPDISLGMDIKIPKLDNDRWECGGCDSIYHITELLTALNPFNPEEEIRGCPNCKSIGDFNQICDEPGCVQVTSSGFPSKIHSIYRRTCSDHSTEMWEIPVEERRKAVQ